MKNIIYLLICLFVCISYSQEKKETVFLLFDSNNKETCITGESTKFGEVVKKYRKVKRKKRIIFYICEESFILDSKNKIDTCDIKYLSKIKFETLKTIQSKRVVSKHVFKNSVFEKIYLIENQNGKIIKYPVIWNTDLVEK